MKLDSEFTFPSELSIVDPQVKIATSAIIVSNWENLVFVLNSNYAFPFDPSDFEEGTYIISIRADDNKGFGYTNITIVIRFEKPLDFVPYIIIGAIIPLAIIGVVVAYIKIPSWIFARRDRRIQKMV